MSERPLPWWLWIVVPVLWASLLTSYRYLDVISDFESVPLREPLINEFTGTAGATLLIPFIAWMTRRFPLPAAPWRRLPLHLAALGACSIAHTSFNWLTRAIAYPLAGLGTFDYGRMPTRYFMELPVDVFTYGLVALVVTLFDRYRAARDRELYLSRRATDLLQARLAQLRAQLRPHFLFNTLNTISSVMYDDVDRADRVLADLSELLRRTIDEDRVEEVPLAEELNLLRLYVDIMKARFQERLDVRIDVPDALLDTRVPPMILQPLVENAIRHGRPVDASRPATVTVRAEAVPDGVRLAVEDDGPGLPATGAVTGGLGLRNTEQRLETLYGPGAGPRLENRPSGGLRASVRVPRARPSRPSETAAVTAGTWAGP